MSPRRTLATARRVLQQLRHDPRTIGLILFVPAVLMIILRWVYNDATAAFDNLAPMVLGIFPLTVMFVVTSVATLRERTGGTLDRLMTLPMAKLDLLLGYALAFASLTILQGIIASSVALGGLGVSVDGGAGKVLLVATLAGLLGMSMGLFLSAFARNEFQAVQFLPAFVLPQFLTCGLFVPRDKMADFLQWLSSVLPMTYIVDAMKQLAGHSTWTNDLVRDLAVVVAFIAGALVLGAATLRRSRA
ncbi:MAG: ABC transporter permease [Candidatus Saccharimonadales bacterium]